MTTIKLTEAFKQRIVKAMLDELGTTKCELRLRTRAKLGGKAEAVVQVVAKGDVIAETDPFAFRIGDDITLFIDYPVSILQDFRPKA